MRIVLAEDYRDMSRKAANIISAQIILKPGSILGLATGSTPVGIYRQLAEWYRKGDLDFSEAATVNLDEYYGLGSADEQSYHYFMEKNFFSQVNLRPERHFLLDGKNEDSDAECARYEALIASLGGIDLQLLGLGHNGHIGFNEPAETFAGGVHLVNLAERTIEANRRFFPSAEAVPAQAYTMGIQTILHAEKILLAVSGEDKAEVLRQVIKGPVSPRVPGSVLQLHPDVVVVADKAAAGKLQRDEQDSGGGRG